MSYAKRKILESVLMSSDTNSISTRLRWIEHAAVQVNVSAVTTPTASVKLQGSTDDINWVDLAGTATTITGTTSILLEQSNIGFKWLRAAFTVSSGDITAEAIFTGLEKRGG